MKIEKFKHTGELVLGNVYIPESYYNEVNGDKSKVWEYILSGNSVIIYEIDESGFVMLGNNNHLGEIHWINDENTHLEVLEFPRKISWGV